MSDLGTCTKCQKVFDIDALYPCDSCEKELCDLCSTYDSEGVHCGCEGCMSFVGIGRVNSEVCERCGGPPSPEGGADELLHCSVCGRDVCVSDSCSTFLTDYLERNGPCCLHVMVCTDCDIALQHYYVKKCIENKKVCDS